MTASRLPVTSTVALWVARVAWLAIAVVGGAAIGDALDDSSRAVQVVGTTAAWVGFGAGAVALALTGVATLTAVRAIVPGSIVVAAVSLAGGADPGRGIALVAPAVLACGAVASAEFGRVYIQASAYGDEDRFGLRGPVTYVVACGVTWMIAVTAVVLTPIAWAARWWAVAPIVTVVAVAGALLLPRRWHQLSRRWLVLVPAGLVVHDPVVLADTLMMQKATLESIRLDDNGTAPQRAADLTGPTPGLAVEVRLDEATTTVLAGSPKNPGGTMIHLTALVVAPTRPGAFLAAAASRGLPVT